MKILENYAYQRRHLYKLNSVFVDGIRYNVMSVTPQHTEKIPKKRKNYLHTSLTAAKNNFLIPQDFQTR